MFDYLKEKVEKKSDIADFFYEYMKEEQGVKINQTEYIKCLKFVEQQLKEGYSLEDIRLLVWGVCNCNPKVKSIYYCKYFWDDLEDFKKLREKYESKKNKENKVEYTEVEEEKENGEVLDEFF